MRREDFLSTFFFGPKNQPLAAWRNKESHLVYFWGGITMPDSEIPPYATRVVFNKDTHLIDQYALVFVEKGVNEENLQKQDYRFVEQGEVKWSKVSIKSKDQKSQSQPEELYVPVRVRVISVMNEGEELEFTNHIQWLFGDDVPDSALVDPRSKEFQEVAFPPLELQESSPR